MIVCYRTPTGGSLRELVAVPLRGHADGPLHPASQPGQAEQAGGGEDQQRVLLFYGLSANYHGQ